MLIFKKMGLATLLFITVCSQSWAIGGVGFIDLFPTFRIATRNFNGEVIDRLYYNQYLQQPKAVVGGIDYSVVGLRFYLAADFFKNLEADSTNFAYSNVPITKKWFAGSINNNWPTESFIEYQHDIVELSIGRRKWGLGYGEYGMVASADNPYFDGLWFGLHPKVGNGRLFYYFNLASDDSTALQDYWNYNEENEVLNNYSHRSKYFVSHKIGYQWEKVRFSITEAAVIYGTPLTFFNANPLMFWHNTYQKNLNVSLSFAGEGLINEDMRLHGEIIADDFGFSASHDDGGNPVAIGMQMGFDWQVLNYDDDEIFVGPNFRNNKNAIREKSFAFDRPGLKLGFQAIYGSTYLYGRKTDDPLGKFTFFNSLQLGVGRWGAMENYIGLPYGPDTVLLKVSANYQKQRWLVDSSIGFLVQGEVGAKATGYYHSLGENFDIEGLYDKNPSNWGLSHVENYMLLVDAKAYYAISQHFAAYMGVNSRLILNHFTLSRFSFETGVGMHF